MNLTREDIRNIEKLTTDTLKTVSLNYQASLLGVDGNSKILDRKTGEKFALKTIRDSKSK